MDAVIPDSSPVATVRMSDASSRPDGIRTREVGWPTLALFVVVSTSVLLLQLWVLYASPSTGGAVGSVWQRNLFAFGSLLILAVGGVIFGVGRLRPADVGLRRAQLAEGVIVTVGVWLLMQIAAAVSAAATTGTIVVARSWFSDGVAPTLAWTAVMFLGAALYEEIGYRGFLFPQLYLKLHGSHRRRFWTALLATQALFAVSHVPAHIAIRNLSGSALLTTVVLQGVAGALFLLLYLRTRNLWVSIGIHGLANAPTPLVEGAWGWETVLIVLVLGWPWLARRPQHRALARVEAVGFDPRAHAAA